jgi:hypothetical protein
MWKTQSKTGELFMRNIRLVMTGALALGLITAAWSRAEKHPLPSTPDKQVAELTGQVRSLQEKIKTLEQRLERLETAEGRTGAVTPPLIFQPSRENQDSIQRYFADPSHPPQIQGEGECNGWKYYFVPLSGRENPSGNPIAPALLTGLRGAAE